MEDAGEEQLGRGARSRAKVCFNSLCDVRHVHYVQARMKKQQKKAARAKKNSL